MWSSVPCCRYSSTRGSVISNDSIISFQDTGSVHDALNQEVVNKIRQTVLRTNTTQILAPWITCGIHDIQVSHVTSLQYNDVIGWRHCSESATSLHPDDLSRWRYRNKMIDIRYPSRWRHCNQMIRVSDVTSTRWWEYLTLLQPDDEISDNDVTATR